MSEEVCTDKMLMKIQYRVAQHMLGRLNGTITSDDPNYLSPQELSCMVKLLKDNGIRVKLSEKLVDPSDPYGFLKETLSAEDLSVPETCKN